MCPAKPKEKGSSLIEFTLAGIPLFFLIISIIEICLAMWSYHSLAYAVEEGARYASTHGQGCTFSGNTCSITVANVAETVVASGAGLAPSQLNLTLTSSGGSVTCNPVSTCYSNTATWPPSGSNTRGSTISVSGYYSVQTGVVSFFMPATGAKRLSSVTLPAESQQIIEF